VIDLSYPNPVTDRDPRGFEALRRVSAAARQEDLQYTPFGGRTVPRRRVAAALSRRYGVRLGFRDIVLTPGATAALALVFAALLRPGDDVVLVTPGWMDYPLYLHRQGVRVVPAPSGPDKRLAPAAVAAACGPRTAAVVISQPVCPTGVVHTGPATGPAATSSWSATRCTATRCGTRASPSPRRCGRTRTP
jgi:aspartate aminotransferase